MKRIVLVPDTHHPYQDQRAIDLMFAATQGYDVCVLMGDQIDNYALSNHDKSPARRTTFLEEAAVTREFLTRCANTYEKVIYLFGNHESRFDRYIAKRAPELHGMTSLAEVLELDELGILHYPYQTSTKLGKLKLTHDTGSAGATGHKHAMNAFMSSVVIGHTHQMEYTVRGRFEDSPVVAAMFGWLGDADQVDYLHRAKAHSWPLGFGVGAQLPSGVTFIQPVPIVGYRCFVDGRVHCG